jgi:hypothetical protein
VKTEIKFTALMAVCMALASGSLAQPHSDTIPGSSGVKKLTSEDIASLMHWELQKLPVTSATEDATDFLRVAKEHEEELPPRFDLLSQELEANGLAGFSDDRSKAEYQKTWESIVKDTLEHSLNPAPTPVLQPSPSVYHTYQAIHAKPSVAATASADSASVAVGASAIGAFFLLFVMGFFYFLPSIVAGSRHHHNGGAVFVINFFLGWTLIGWAVALAWAFTTPALAQQATVYIQKPDGTLEAAPTAAPPSKKVPPQIFRL